MANTEVQILLSSKLQGVSFSNWSNPRCVVPFRKESVRDIDVSISNTNEQVSVRTWAINNRIGLAIDGL